MYSAGEPFDELVLSSLRIVSINPTSHFSRCGTPLRGRRRGIDLQSAPAQTKAHLTTRIVYIRLTGHRMPDVHFRESGPRFLFLKVASASYPAGKSVRRTL